MIRRCDALRRTGLHLIHESLGKLGVKEMVSPRGKDAIVVEEANILGVNLGQNVATAGVCNVVVEHCPQLQGCTNRAVVGPRLLLSHAASKEQERFGQVQYLLSLAAIYFLQRVDVGFAR